MEVSEDMRADFKLHLVPIYRLKQLTTIMHNAVALSLTPKLGPPQLVLVTGAKKQQLIGLRKGSLTLHQVALNIRSALFNASFPSQISVVEERSKHEGISGGCSLHVHLISTISLLFGDAEEHFDGVRRVLSARYLKKMTTKPTPKVRLVRCPKCRRLLPELANLPVYECGGCGTVLRAKRCKEDGKNVSSGPPEIDPAKNNEPEQDSEDKESISLSRKVILTEECYSDLKNEMDQNESGYCNKQRSRSIKISNGVSSLGELTCHENEESSSESGGNIEVTGNYGSGSYFTCTSPDSQQHSMGRNSILAAQRSLDKSISSETYKSFLNEYLEQSQKIVHNDFDHIRSRETVETTEFVDHRVISEELSSGVRDVSKSPLTRSPHAYDGSVSSYDELDDQVPDQHLHLSKRNLFKTQKVAEFVGTIESPTKDNVPMNNMISSNSEVRHLERKFLSMSSNEKYNLAGMECANWDREESREPKRHGIRAQKQVNSQYSKGFHPVSNRMRLERDGFQSREPLYPRGSLDGCEIANPSSHGNEEFLCGPSFYTSEKPEYHEQDRVDLLKMVDDLRDQLNRSYTRRGKENGRIPTEATQQEKQRLAYCNYEASEGEVLQHCDTTYPPYPPGRFGPRKNRLQQCGVSQMPFSGQITNCRHHVDYSCLHCYPLDWQYQLQFPPHGICCNKGLCRGYPDHIRYEPYSSSPASPRQYMDSDFPLRGHDTQSRERRCMDNKVNMLYLRERRQAVKRHCRPIAGGAPFIMCYCCRKLLQLPSDFLLPRKKCHRIRCGGCSEELKFSFHNGIQIGPYSPNAIVPPPSEVDNSRSYDCLQGDPVSYSEDYGLSFCKSGSTVGEPAFLPDPPPTLQSNSDDRKKSSGTAFQLMEEREKLVLKQTRYKQKNPAEASESALPSFNMDKSEKLAVVLPKSVSPLHRLMGYSSPSEMINRSGAGTHSFNDPEKNSRSRD
ncbi:hypothetical protein HHK36_018747 [Tetracentron sinense]|uniref:Zinc-ribbon domain-containing protein n=1 Tax=Tetracentron sinense TaxID=13715 RepID=A0A834YY57_TETSI|nr:hypothetical protein HHK36_018747 [Tetracentron sinense]